jgi:predicted amidohydrolase
MPRSIKIAAVQMDADVAPTHERLERADDLVAEAAGAGADLVVLPEIFNIGYHYDESNYRRAETWDGPTVTWMRDTAARLKIHLAGTLLLLDDEDIYNTMLLFAPDGRYWRYDKNFPWYWERAYFRANDQITVADTDLGKLGMLICWDAAHPELWERYRGKVDAMVVASCPPAMHDMKVHLPDDTTLGIPDEGILGRIKHSAAGTFNEHLLKQAQNMNVPVVNTTGTGNLKTHIPAPHVSMLTFAAVKPELLRHLPQADDALIETAYFNDTFVATAGGDILSKVPEGEEGYVVAEVELAPVTPTPIKRQPAFGIFPLVYGMDTALNTIMTPVYRHNVRKHYGKRMAPMTTQTRQWIGMSMLSLLFGYVIGKLRG